MSNSKITKALEYLQNSHNAEWCTAYGEPGYTDPEAGIILCNWNDVPKGLADWLEKCGYSLEWSDEWMIDYDYSKAYRTNPDSYSWESNIALTDDGEWLTRDDDAATWIEHAEITSNGQPVRCVPSWISAADITGAGFTLYAEGMESGFHIGMDDSPEKIARELIAQSAYRVLFQKSEQSQFYCRFAVYVDMVGDSE